MTTIPADVVAELRARQRTAHHFGRFTNSTDAPELDVTIPDSPAALEELLADRKQMAKVATSPAHLQELIRNYARVVLNRDQEIATQVRAETQRVVAEFLRDSQEDGLVPVDLDTTKRLTPYGSDNRPRNQKYGLFNKRAMGAQLDDMMKGENSAAEFFSLIWHNAQRTAENQAKLTRLRNAFSSDVPSDGGFLIPETLRSELLATSLETAIVRPRARTIPMESLRVPFPAVDSTSNVSSVFGGVVAYWTEEGGTLNDSSPAFRRIVLEAKKLTAYSVIPNELIADSIGSLQAFIDQIYPEAITYYEDIAFLKEDGVGKPTGILHANNLATITVAKETNQPAATIVWENIVKMFARMLPQSLGRAVWVASIDTLPELATMALSVGTGGAPIWLSDGTQGVPVSILGRPVIFTEKTPGILGTQGDINFVDFGFYLIGDRQSMSASSSPHFRFQTDETAYRIISRVDGLPWLTSAITPQNSGPTLSPYVQLATRA
jgi:HK97 family phage major capsid protein